MKFKINKDVLLENLNNVGRALSNRNIIPVINGILFELNEDGLSLMATDNEITIKTFIDKSNMESLFLILLERYLKGMLKLKK